MIISRSKIGNRKKEVLNRFWTLVTDKIIVFFHSYVKEEGVWAIVSR